MRFGEGKRALKMTSMEEDIKKHDHRSPSMARPRLRLVDRAFGPNAQRVSSALDTSMCRVYSFSKPARRRYLLASAEEKRCHDLDCSSFSFRCNADLMWQWQWERI
jgi:hypothetical protein